MPNLDVFKADGFSLTSLTDAILKAPYKPGRIGQLGIFRDRGITTTTVQIEEKAGQLSLIPTSPRGGVPDTMGQSKRKLRSFVVPHLAREATIMADEVQNIRSFGSESDEQVVQALVTEYLTTLRAEHEVTLEHLRMGALQGSILDADGSSELHDLFTEFDVIQQTVDFNFGTDDIRNKCVEVARAIEGELGATPYSQLRGFAGKDWFDTLVADSGVKTVFQYQQGQVLGQDLRKGFMFGGIMWEEYRGSIDGVDFVDDAEAWVYPDAPIFATYYAPADFVETVNTIGLPIYAKQAVDAEFQRWVKLHTQSNPLPLCLRPRCVIKVTQS
jgi:hypothetical protein